MGLIGVIAMFFKFGDYELEIDVERTRQFYLESIQDLTEGCDCPGCRNFRKAYEQMSREVKSFFWKLGVDILKAPDMSVYYGNSEKQTLFYNGFVHLCGEILKDGALRTIVTPNQTQIEAESWYVIAEECSVMFTKDCALLESGFPAPVIQMEVCMDIPWVLDGEKHALLM